MKSVLVPRPLSFVPKNSRRDFLRKAGIGAAGLTLGNLAFPASSLNRIKGANDRVRIAMIGCFRRFNAVMDSMPLLSNDLTIAYVCDVDQTRLLEAQSKVWTNLGYRPQMEKDLRKIMDDKSVDAVYLAIPDHWHAPAAIMAMKAGKHVYLEKPCSHNPREGELLVDNQKKYKRVVQMGTQQRSAPETREIIHEIHSGLLGEPYMGVAFYINSRGMVPVPQPVDPPATLDWELFQGPAPRAPYMDVYFDYNWHWFWPYGTGETGNNAVHELDICRWALQLKHPRSVFVNAGKHHFREDGWQMYDTMDASFMYEGEKTIKWDGKSRNNYKTYGLDRGSIIYGTSGTAMITRNGYQVFDREGKMIREKKAEEVSQTTQAGGAGSMDALHIGNFLETIRGTAAEQHMPISEGATSTLLGHLANISYRVNAKLDIDPDNGHILNNDKAMQLWKREYEKGWEPE